MSQPSSGDPPPVGGGTMPPTTHLIVCRLNGMDFVTNEEACDAAGGEVIVRGPHPDVARRAGPLVGCTLPHGQTVEMTELSRDEILNNRAATRAVD